MTNDDWEAGAGETCSCCGLLDVRIIDGMCRACYKAKVEGLEEALARKTEKRQAIAALLRGDLTLSQIRRGDY